MNVKLLLIYFFFFLITINYLLCQNFISNRIITDSIVINKDCKSSVINKFGKIKLKKSYEWGKEDGGVRYILDYKDIAFVFTKEKKSYILNKVKIKTINSEYKIKSDIDIGSTDSTVIKSMGTPNQIFNNTNTEKMFFYQNINNQNLYLYFIKKGNETILNNYEVW